MTCCPECGAELQIGDYPFCPHGRAGAGGVIDDQLPGGARYIHNLGDDPVWVETKSQMAQELASRGLRQVERSTYNRDDSSPYATRTRLKPGRVDPFVTGGSGRRNPRSPR